MSHNVSLPTASGNLFFRSGYQKMGRFIVVNDDAMRPEQDVVQGEQAEDMKRTGSGSETESIGQPLAHLK